jgi:cell division inhibitor SepF
MAVWKKMMDYLGLGPDDAYDDYEAAPEPERPVRRSREPEPPRSARSDYEPEGTVRTMPSRPSFPQRDPESTARRPTPAPDDSSVQPRPINAPRQSSATRVVPGQATGDPYTVRPRRFDSAQEIADKFKEGLPVIMNLEAADREVSRRLIDFASGICYALNGSMEKVATGVYLLKPISSRSNGYDD